VAGCGGDPLHPGRRDHGHGLVPFRSHARDDLAPNVVSPGSHMVHYLSLLVVLCYSNRLQRLVTHEYHYAD